MLKEFRDFAVKGNVVDMAVGIIIGGAFTTVVTSLVNDVIMPPIAMATGDLDFSDRFFVLADGKDPGPYATLASARAAGATVLSYGLFINAMVAFLIIALVLFFIVRWIASLRRPEAQPATTKACPECKSTIHIDARRCPACTTKLAA